MKLFINPSITIHVYICFYFKKNICDLFKLLLGPPLVIQCFVYQVLVEGVYFESQISSFDPKKFTKETILQASKLSDLTFDLLQIRRKGLKLRFDFCNTEVYTDLVMTQGKKTFKMPGIQILVDRKTVCGQS